MVFVTCSSPSHTHDLKGQLDTLWQEEGGQVGLYVSVCAGPLRVAFDFWKWRGSFYLPAWVILLHFFR